MEILGRCLNIKICFRRVTWAEVVNAVKEILIAWAEYIE